MTGGVLSVTTTVCWHVFWTPPLNVRTTRMTNEPTVAVVTVTLQLVTWMHEFEPMNEAPAVLLRNENVALKGVFGWTGDVAVNTIGLPHWPPVGPAMLQKVFA